MLDPTSIQRALQLLLEDPALVMSSLMCPCPERELDNPACVKVVCALNGDALYFSRARLPFERDAGSSSAATVMQHIGLYTYRNHFLQMYLTLPPSPLERTEGLEQLRVLEHGYRIRMARIENAPLGVDTPEDLERARQLLAGFSPPDV